MSGYPVPAVEDRVEYRHGNSLFIASVARADTVEQAREYIRNIRAEMPDATHHVYAMKIGYGASTTEGMSDDGEPSGTSGPPILAIIRGREIGDIVLVVTRYFGGTKLGTGGLVTVYGNAARAILDKLVTERKVDRTEVAIVCDYSLHRNIRQALDDSETLVDQEVFTESVKIIARVETDRLDALRETIKDLSAGRVEVETIPEAR